MYVCICNAVTDRQIRHAVRGGVVTFEQLRMQLPIARCCGRCEPHARQVLAQALAEEFPAMPSGAILPDSIPA